MLPGQGSRSSSLFRVSGQMREGTGPKPLGLRVMIDEGLASLSAEEAWERTPFKPNQGSSFGGWGSLPMGLGGRTGFGPIVK